MMKMKSLMLAAMAFVIGMSSCSSSSNDDVPEVAVADQVAGSYTGKEEINTMGEIDTDEAANFVFAKSTEVSIDMTIPPMGGGMMSIPALPVKNIPLTKNGNTITGKLDKYPVNDDKPATVKNANGEEKTYTVSHLSIVFSDKTVAVTYSLKYGNMPFDMVTQFTGTKK